VGEFADVLMQVGEWYGEGAGMDRMPALLAIEANNMGIATIKRCLESGYRNLWHEHDLRTGEVKERVGWVTNEVTRRLMLGKYQTEYRMGRLKIVDRDQLEEMALFAHRGPRGKAQAPPGKCDDTIVSYGVTLFVATYEGPAEEKPEVEMVGARGAAMLDIKKMLEGTGEPYNQGVEELGG
jgi:hypothetical protein